MTQASHIVETNQHQVEVHRFQKALCEWGAVHFREFPWRHTRDPYHLLIAEIMLHRTQAKQVSPVYKRFIDQYPTLISLSKAPKASVMLLLQPLGLHWRSNLLMTMVDTLMSEWSGSIPRQKINLLQLPGVSDYIASALRCFAWDEPDALIDTNTVRVIGRVFGLNIRPSSRRNRQFRDLIAAMVDSHHPRQYQFALLDLAAQICLPRDPRCMECPLVSQCLTGLQRVNMM